MKIYHNKELHDNSSFLGPAAGAIIGILMIIAFIAFMKNLNAIVFIAIIIAIVVIVVNLFAKANSKKKLSKALAKEGFTFTAFCRGGYIPNGQARYLLAVDGVKCRIAISSEDDCKVIYVYDSGEIRDVYSGLELYRDTVSACFIFSASGRQFIFPTLQRSGRKTEHKVTESITHTRTAPDSCPRKDYMTNMCRPDLKKAIDISVEMAECLKNVSNGIPDAAQHDDVIPGIINVDYDKV